MAFTIEYVPDFIDEVAPKMIEAGLRIVEPAVRDAVDWAQGRTGHKGTGQLKRSVTSSNVFDNQAGRFRATVYFKGTRERKNYQETHRLSGGRRKASGSKGVIRNNEIAAYLEYGTPNTPNHNQEPTHFLKSARTMTEKRVNDEMQRVFDEAVGKVSG